MDAEDTRFTAEMLVAYAARERGIAVGQIGVAPVVVMSWFPAVIRSLAERTAATRSEHWIYGERHALYSGEIEGQPISFAHAPVGAPGTITMMEELEELVACGARVFWGLGLAGGLQDQTVLGRCIIPTAGIAEEGTSRHYLDADTVIAPAQRLVAIAEEVCELEGIDVLSGPVWTTDAPYRETVSKIQEYCRQGALGVDMETSAMYAFGQAKGVEVCNLLVVSDELLREWRPGFLAAVVSEALNRLERVVLRCAAAAATSKGFDPHG